MKRFLMIGLSLLLSCGLAQAQIFKGVELAKGLRVDGWKADWCPESITELSMKAMRPIYQATRRTFSQTYLLKQAPRGLVQIKTKANGEVRGSGFLLVHENKLYVATARHISGHVGSTFVAEVFNKDGSPLRFKVKVGAGGQRGYHLADMSLSEISWDALKGGAKPFDWAAPDLSLPAYSFGYTSGPWGQRDILPMERRFLEQGKWELVGTRPTVPLENPDEPFGFSGYCGSPVLQLQEGRWVAVAGHMGSCGVVSEPENNRSFAVNLSKVLPLLSQRLAGDISSTQLRPVKLFGTQIAQLDWGERIYGVIVFRGEDEEIVSEQILNLWVHAFDEERLEDLFENITLQSGDRILIDVETRRTDTGMRYVHWVVP